MNTLLSVASLAILMTVNAWAATQPNIVLILADDLGWKDVGYQGAKFYETPNIDRLAREGMVFSQAYVAAANCQPSRACLLSGNYTVRHGVYAVDRTDRGPEELQRLLAVPNKSGLAVENVTLADALKAAGYVTGIFGKWHLGGPDGASPAKQGFDVVVDTYAGAEMGGELPKAAKRPQRNQQRKEDPKGIYSLTAAASAFMTTNRHRPFFAYVAHHAVHTRHQARPETLQRFQQKAKAFADVNALYAACIYDLDDGVGLLLQKLQELGLEKETVVIFTSDNGGAQKCSQEPLRGNKGCYYEGGIREPFIARWPGRVQPGTTCDVPVILIDLYPTFLSLAGAKPAPGKVLDGEDLLPLFLGKTRLKREAIYWHFPGYLDSPVSRGRDPVFRTRPVSVIRQGDWKLHLYHEEWQLEGGRDGLATNNAVELYHLKNDLGEWKNLALESRSKRDQMLEDLLRWMDAVKAPMPTRKNPAYTGIPKP